MSSLVMPILSVPELIERSKVRFDAALLRYDAWFLVFVAVILSIGVGILAGLAIWCVAHERKNFTGAWQFKDFGINVAFECR
ncbi:hypothetical protein [Sinomonas susongensis]|uniref:hypothetical protein n=1 Tax=Sinomonas susongensis TaxID=1324851 RepID=UPI001BB24EB6|nr:hypothetical protein [Sinomonas susongensis]